MNKKEKKPKPKKSLYERAWDRMADFGFIGWEMDFIFAPWPEGDRHFRWLLRASRDAVQDWIDSNR